MATINFGSIPPNMYDDLAWGFENYVSDQDPILAEIPTPTRIVVADPVYESTIELLGAFNLQDIAQEIFSTSYADSGTFRAASGELLMSLHVDPPLPLTLLFDVDEPFPIFIADDDVITGGIGNDTLFGSSGDDIIGGAQGNDTVDGGSGIDTAMFFEPFGNFVPDVGPDWAYIDLVDTVSSQGTDRLIGIERVEFEDTGFALDVDPLAQDEASLALALATAAFDAPAVGDKDLLGWMLSLFRDGLFVDEVAQAVIDAYAPPGFTVRDEIYHLYAMIFDGTPDPSYVDEIENMVVSGGWSQAELYVAASQLPENLAQFEQVTLAGYVEYTPEILL